jgi:hypothetical protein
MSMSIRTLKLAIKIHLTTAIGDVKANEAIKLIEELERLAEKGIIK